VALYTIPTNTNNTIIQAADVNQAVYVLQQPSGGQEAGHYVDGGNGYQSGAEVSAYVTSLSRNSTPVSVSIDQTDGTIAGLNSPTTATLTSGGFGVHTTSTGANTNCYVGGNYTISY